MSMALGQRTAVALWSLVALALTGVARPVDAARSRVVIARDADSADPVIDRAEVRLAAELRAAGFDVEERSSNDDDARKLVEQSLVDAPFATVLLRRVGAGAATDVWVADHVSHKTVVRRIFSQGPAEGGDRALALRVVELMRASLVEAILLAPSDSTSAPPPPDVSRWTREAIPAAPREEPTVLLGVGIAAVFASADVGFAIAPELDVAWRARGLWFVHAVVAGPAAGGRVQGAQGSATVRQEFALIDVSRELPIGRFVSLFASIGAGAYHIDVSGNGPQPFIIGQRDQWCLLGAGGGGARVRLSPAASVTADSRLLVASPRPVIFIDRREAAGPRVGEQVATAMSPGILAELTLVVGL